MPAEPGKDDDLAKPPSVEGESSGTLLRRLSAAELAQIRRELVRSGVAPRHVDDALAQVLAKLAALPQTSIENLLAYLKRSVHRRQIDFARSEQTRLDKERRSPPRPEPESPVQNAVSSEERRRLHSEMVSRLSKLESWLVYEHYYNNRSLRDLAHKLGKSHEYVRQQLEQAIETLRRHLSE